MTDILRLIDHPLVATLGWTLTHFVWQGAMLGLVAFFLLRVVRPREASTRYLIGVGTLAAMLVVPVVSFIATSGRTASERTTWRPSADAVSSAGAVTGSMVATFEANPAAVRQWLPTRGMPATNADAAPIAPMWLPLVTASWMLGVAVLSLRLIGGWALTQWLARRAVAAVSSDVEAAAHEMARRLALRRRFAVLESAAVTVPTLVGWFKPVVLLPAVALTGLTPLQLQAILAHELAHIRRHDYLVNLLQSCVETLLFYHPAVWWVSGEVRAEREHCCDDLAVDVCGDRLVYVSALAELTAIERRAFALAATDGSLVTRVRRILGRPVAARHELPPSWGILVLLILIGSGAGTYEMSADANDVEQIAHAAAQAPALDQARWSDASSQGPEVAGVQEGQQVPPVPPAPQVAPAPPVPASAIAPLTPPVPLTPSAAPIAPAPVAPVAPPFGAFPAAPPAPVAPVAPPFGAFSPAAPAPVAPVAPAFGVPVAPAPATPAPPAPPAPAFGAPTAPPALPAQKGEGNFTWSNDGERLTVRWTGPFRLADDERDIAWIEEGARLTIADGWVFTDRIEMRGLPGGAVERKFYRSGLEREFDAEARAFLVNSLQRMIRSGMFAADRVARLLKQGGPDAVLDDIERLGTTSGYVKRVYYSALLKQADLTSAQLTRVLDQVTKGITSDYEKGTLLTQVLQRSGLTQEQRLSAIRAARSISSDYEQRKVLTAALAQTPVPGEVTLAALDVADTITSSHDRSQVLLAIARQGGVTPQTSSRFMTAVSTMSSGHDQRQVLAAVASTPALPESVAIDAVKAAGAISSAHDKRQAVSAYIARPDVSPKVAAAALASAGTIGSPHDKAQVLLEVIAKDGVTDATAGSFFSAVGSIGSAYEMTRVLRALVAKGPLSDRLLAGTLETAKKISSAHDRATLLLAMIKSHPIAGANRTLFLDVADGISSAHEQNQVLAALVRAERR